MPRVAKEITDTQLQIISVIWEQGQATVRYIQEQIYPQGTASHYATVQKLLQRLESKRFVKRNRKSWPHRFEANIDRDELIARDLQATANRLCEGSLASLLSSLVKANLSPEDLTLVRTMIDEAKRNKRR